jgi:hypothetical protein
LGFKFKIEKPEIVKDLYLTHFFAGGSFIKNTEGKTFGLGKMGGVDWSPYDRIHPSDMLIVMEKIFGKPNQPCIDDYKMSFCYFFKSRKFKGFYYEIYDYYGSLSCGVGRPDDFDVKATKEIVDGVNNELRELIHELVKAYNLMRPE